MKSLIEKELNTPDKILKPDFASKSGRELLAFYLQAKFKQILVYDKHCVEPLFVSVNPNFANKFAKRLINNPSKRLLIGITGESASGKSTICKEIKKNIERFNLPVSVLSTDNYFNDISKEIKEYTKQRRIPEKEYDPTPYYSKLNANQQKIKNAYSDHQFL